MLVYFTFGSQATVVGRGPRDRAYGRDAVLLGLRRAQPAPGRRRHAPGPLTRRARWQPPAAPPTDAVTGATRLGVMLAIVDFPMLSTAFRSVIDQERDMRVVGEVTGRETIVEQARATNPDVIVLECESVGGFGCGTYDSIEAIRSACPDAKIIALDCRCAIGAVLGRPQGRRQRLPDPRGAGQRRRGRRPERRGRPHLREPGDRHAHGGHVRAPEPGRRRSTTRTRRSPSASARSCSSPRWATRTVRSPGPCGSPSRPSTTTGPT